MSPSLRRYFPFIIGAFVLLILLPALFKRGSSSTAPSAQATQTRGALKLVDHAEQRYDSAHGRYTSHVADLLLETHSLATDLTDGYVIQLDVSTDGQTYYALVESPVLSLLRARHDGKLIADTCVVVKSESGVSCPTSTPAASTKKST